MNIMNSQKNKFLFSFIPITQPSDRDFFYQKKIPKPLDKSILVCYNIRYLIYLLKIICQNIYIIFKFYGSRKRFNSIRLPIFMSRDFKESHV